MLFYVSRLRLLFIEMLDDKTQPAHTFCFEKMSVNASLCRLLINLDVIC